MEKFEGLGRPADTGNKDRGAFLGPDKAPVGTDSAYVFGRARRLVSSRVIDDTTLAAGERGCFLIFNDIPFARVSEAFAKVSWSFAQLEALRGNVVTENLVQDADSFGQLVLRGQLRNAGSVPIFQCHISTCEAATTRSACATSSLSRVRSFRCRVA